MVIAHRGYRKYAQDNTISAFDKAILAGARGIECDIRLTADNKVVVSHDNNIVIENRKVKISNHSVSDLKKICENS